VHLFYPFRLALDAPALLTGLEGDPNSAITLDHIPGSVLRGVVAGRVGTADRAAFDALVLDGGVRYLHAWPVRDQQRGVPVPVSQRAVKGAKRGACVVLHDLAAWDGRPRDDHERQGEWPEESLGAPPAGCVTLGSSDPGIVTAKRSSRVHQQRDRVRGRAWTRHEAGREEAAGTIFSYESLDAGQTFEGLILVEGRSEAALHERFAAVKRALEGRVLLGRSRRAGYGGDATLTWMPPRAREIEGTGVLRGPVQAGQAFRALLTSPCIVRSEATGQVDPGALPEELVARLGGRVKVLRRRCAFTMVGGFNRYWGLELPQALAVAAGSVLVLEAVADLPHDDLVVAEREGVGERRTEGFGRVCFFDEAAPQFGLRNEESDDLGATAVPSGEAPSLVAWFERRVLSQALDEALLAESERIAASASGVPTRSLLGRLRVPLRGDARQALETLRVWLGDGLQALRRPARGALNRCRVEVRQVPRTLASWITQITNGTGAEEALPIEAIIQRRRVVSEDSARAWLESQRDAWRVRLLDATLAAIARKAPRER
jgi:CRISPR-associated protein Csx10